MFFGLRRHALRITDRMGLPVLGAENAALVATLISSAKRAREVVKHQTGRTLSDEVAVLVGAGTLQTDAVLKLRFEREAGISRDRTLAVLDALQKSVDAIATEMGTASH